jgi:hypothetical protein
LERHIFPDSGQACTLLLFQRWELWPVGAPLLKYVEGPMRNYFIGQALVENGDPWPFGEWGHGIEGVVQYFQELLSVAEAASIVPTLKAIATEDWKGHRDCPCGNGKRTRHCHGEVIRSLRERMGPEQATRAAVEFMVYRKHCEQLTAT